MLAAAVAVQTSDPGASFDWVTLWAALLGACLAIAGGIATQLWVAPIVETRRRRMQRWEDQAQDLCDFINSSTPTIVRAWMLGIFNMQEAVQSGDATVIQSRAFELQQAEHLAINASTRILWMVEQLRRFNLSSDRLNAVIVATEQFGDGIEALSDAFQVSNADEDGKSNVILPTINEAGDIGAAIAASASSVAMTLLNVMTECPPKPESWRAKRKRLGRSPDIVQTDLAELVGKSQ